MQREKFKKGLVMEYKAIKYSNKEDALVALNKMRQRKKDWIEKTVQEFAELRKLQVTV